MHLGTLRDLWKRKDVGFAVLVVFLAVGALLFGGLQTIQHNGAVQENRPVEAVVTGTAVDHRIVEDSEGNEDHEYRPVVTYEYVVDGTTYTQDNVFPGPFHRWRGSRAWAERVAAEYAPGDRIEARYNPRKPSDAFIRNDGWPGGWFVSLGFGVAVAVGGIVLIVSGFRRRNQRMLMADTPTEQAESLSMGPSEIVGRATMGDLEPARAPFTDEACVVADWRILEYDEDGDDSGWELVAEGVRFVPFYVDDGTGAVLVRPHEDAIYEIDEGGEVTLLVPADRGVPSTIRSFVDAESEVAGVPDAPDAEPDTGVEEFVISGGDGFFHDDGDRKYIQNLITPGEEVYVFGTVQPREEGGGRENVDNLVIAKVPGDDRSQEPMFLIADEPERELIAERRWALWRIPVGVLAIVYGVGLWVAIVGPAIGIRLPVL